MFEGHPNEALEWLRQIMQAKAQPISRLENDLAFENSYCRMSPDIFEFDTPGGARFRYTKGADLELDCLDPSLASECQLYQFGTVYGAVAWMNEFVPLHASCVARGGAAVAFTAESGVGKSTLAAALAETGMRPVCDDTLVLSRYSGCFFALPDRKLAKLSRAAAEALGFECGEPVPFSEGKFYVDLPNAIEQPVPLRHLILLEDGDEIELSQVKGAAKLELIGSSLYRGFIHGALNDKDAHASLMISLANGLECWRLSRPRTEGAPADLAVQISPLLDQLV